MSDDKIILARGTEDVRRALRMGKEGTKKDPTVAQMEANRQANSKTAMGDVSLAMQRPTDLMFYLRQSALPFDLSKADEFQKLRDLCRVLYATHDVIGPAIDVFSKWPLTGLEFTSKDSALTEFHTDLFFGDDLDYEEFLVDVGREYWTVGEAFPLATWNSTLGVWDNDELVDPDNVHVERSMFVREPLISITMPESVRKILSTQQPPEQYKALIDEYPELANHTGANDKLKVNNHLIKHLKFKVDSFSPRGVPLLLRALKPVLTEEMLNAAQRAIASRLYTPLILTKLGASASDLGMSRPWIPTPEQIGEFETQMNVALAADFRMLTTHFAVDIQSVFGKETMPNFDADFERIESKILQVFGLSKTFLSGAGAGETYAADAINRDVVSQLLGSFQRSIKRFVRQRMLVVAEAQQHFDYDVKGGRRVPKMQEVLVQLEDGTQVIEERPKLLVPNVEMKSMNLNDDKDLRQFYEALREGGAPVSLRTRTTNVPFDLDDEVQKSREEAVQLAIEQQITRRETYIALRAQNLPIPEDLRKDFEPRVADDGAAKGGEGEEEIVTRMPSLGVDPITPTPDIAPTAEDLATPAGEPIADGGTQAAPEGAEGAEAPAVAQMPGPAVPRQRPVESDEARGAMPKASLSTGPTHLSRLGKIVQDSINVPIMTDDEDDDE